MKSNIRLYGPRIPEAIERLTKLASEIKDLPISGGKVVFGKYDFIFNWLEDPKPTHLVVLLEKIDDSLTGLPSKYSITTESRHTSRVTADMGKANYTIFSFIRIHGPSISKALRAIEQVILKMEPTNPLETLKSSVLIGEFDYAFEWDHWPSSDEVVSVLSAIDDAVLPTGALYTVTTKKVYRTEKHIDDHTSEQLMAFL
ncbi:MAG: hypothetical protein ACXAC8_15375 [Candidatus Hodarchaeales archaeon]